MAATTRIENCEIRIVDDALTVELEYPRQDAAIKAIEIGLTDVRAADGIRITYDFERDGWSIQQPICDSAGFTVDWKETSFAQSWALAKENDDAQV